MTVDRSAGRLHHEDVHPAHVFLDLQVDFSIGKRLDGAVAQGNLECFADFFRQGLIGRAGKYAQPAAALSSCKLRERHGL